MRPILFREEIYTDRKIGVIRCLVPVTAEGKVDESRKVILYRRSPDHDADGRSSDLL